MKKGVFSFGTPKKARATMNSEIIVVKQLPVITEQLQTIKVDVTRRVNEAMSLVCTEETVKDLKKIRAELNAERKQWEDKRKTVKQAIMAPYLQFEAVYKECVTDVYDTGDADLKRKIDEVENEQKDNKLKEVSSYFEELCKAYGLDFLTFEDARIKITLSASLKSLKEQAKEFVDRVCDDLRLIETQKHKEEILYEYKQSLNVSAAITTVSNRYKAKAAEQAKQEAAAKVEAVAPPTVEEKPLTVSFKVTATRSKLKELKAFLNNGGYDYE